VKIPPPRNEELVAPLPECKYKTKHML